MLFAESLLRFNGFSPAGNSPFSITKVLPAPPLRSDSILGTELKDGKYTIVLRSGMQFTANHHYGSRNVPVKPNRVVGQVWLYGCSFFYGFGLPDSAVVSNKLSILLDSFQVMNRSVPGYSDLQSFLKMKQDISLWEENDVVVFSCASFHSERNAMLLSYRNKLFTFGSGELLNQMTFPKAVLLENSMYVIHKPFSYPAFPFREKSSLVYLLEQTRNCLVDESDNVNAITRQVLQEVWKEASTKKVRFAFAPLTKDLSTEVFMTELQAQGVPIIDLSLDFGDWQNTLMPLDAHPNESSHAYFADCIFDWLHNRNRHYH